MAALTTIYHYDNGDEFPVKWTSEADAENVYTWDAQHTPFASTPLAVDFLEKVWTQPALINGLHAIFGTSVDPLVHPHGYVYIPERPVTPQMTSNPKTQETRDRSTRLAPLARQLWEEEYEPKLRLICQEIACGQHDSISLPDVVTRLKKLFDLAAGGFDLTMLAFGPMASTHFQLLAFCQEEFKEDANRLVDALEGGFANATSSADVLIWKLASLARTNPEIKTLLTARSDANVLAALESDTPFSKVLNQYLDRYGSRAGVWFDMAEPTAKERPVSVLEQIKKAPADDDLDPRRVTNQSARIRRATTRRLRDQLREKPQRLAEFERVVENARQYTFVKEGRALSQMTLTGTLRIPCLAAGKKLSDLGVLESPEDIFYLHMDEIDKIAVAPEQGSWNETVVNRRREYAIRKATNPPGFFGGKYEALSNVTLNGMMPLVVGEVLSGIPASAGIIEGPATVVRTLDEAVKLSEGDILICNSTSPAWSMLFSHISAVVTTGGGPLSHTAIVAREYKIPCVLNVEGVTVKIQDGMRIRVDGTKGTVELVD